MVTGGTGYLGSWIVRYLLEGGYDVQLPVRDKSLKKRHKHLLEFAENSTGKLKLWFNKNILDEHAYDESMDGCICVFHSASPFLLNSKNPEEELLNPALKGTKNILDSVNRTKSITKVVLTSSVAAIYGDNVDMLEQGLDKFNESHFNTSSSLSHQPYSFSKLMAEKAAWEIAERQNKWKLLVINPGFILGPILSKSSNSESINFMKDIINGKFYLGAPQMILSCVDVRDAARAHISVFENENSLGRHIVVNKSFKMLEIMNVVKKIYGRQFKLPNKESAKWLTVLLGPIFGVSRKFVKRNVGYPVFLDNGKSKKSLGLKYTNIENTIDEMVKSILQ